MRTSNQTICTQQGCASTYLNIHNQYPYLTYSITFKNSYWHSALLRSSPAPPTPFIFFPVYWFQCMFLRTIFLDQNWHVCIILYNHIIFIYIYTYSLFVWCLFIYLIIYLFDMIYNLLHAFVWCISPCIPKFLTKPINNMKQSNATMLHKYRLPTSSKQNKRNYYF